MDLGSIAYLKDIYQIYFAFDAPVIATALSVSLSCGAATRANEGFACTARGTLFELGLAIGCLTKGAVRCFEGKDVNMFAISAGVL